MPEITAAGKIRARVRMDAVKIYRENSPDVIEGRVPLGHREPIETQSEQIIELTREQCIEMFGEEKTEMLFKGANDEQTEA